VPLRAPHRHADPTGKLRMFENRNRQLDIFALVLLAVTCFVGVSLATYDRTDPPAQLVYPAPSVVANACGRGGAMVAHKLYESLGVVAWYAWGSLALATALLAWRSRVNQPAIRFAGWLLTLVALAALASMLFPNWTPGPIVGAGGFVGALGRTWLESHFAAAGTYIFALCVLAAGLLLCTDYLLLHVAAVTGTVAGRGLARASKLAGTPRVKTDLEGAFDNEESDDDEETEYEYEYEDAHDPRRRTECRSGRSGRATQVVSRADLQCARHGQGGRRGQQCRTAAG
jgi:hypothetical protein